MNDPMKHARLATALDMLRNSEGYKKGTPEQQATLESIVSGAAKAADQAVASALIIMIAPAMNARYENQAVLGDTLMAGLNAFKAAVIVETLMKMWPDANDAPDVAIEAGRQATEVYRRNISAFKHLSEALLDSRRDKEPS